MNKKTKNFKALANWKWGVDWTQPSELFQEKLISSPVTKSIRSIQSIPQKKPLTRILTMKRTAQNHGSWSIHIVLFWMQNIKKECRIPKVFRLKSKDQSFTKSLISVINQISKSRA